MIALPFLILLAVWSTGFLLRVMPLLIDRRPSAEARSVDRELAELRATSVRLQERSATALAKESECRHLEAVPVESSGEIVAWLCPSCDRQLSADWTPSPTPKSAPPPPPR